MSSRGLIERELRDEWKMTSSRQWYAPTFPSNYLELGIVSVIACLEVVMPVTNSRFTYLTGGGNTWLLWKWNTRGGRTRSSQLTVKKYQTWIKIRCSHFIKSRKASGKAVKWGSNTSAHMPCNRLTLVPLIYMEDRTMCKMSPPGLIVTSGYGYGPLRLS